MIQKIIGLLNVKERITFVLITFALMIGMILEFASIGLLVPILSILLKGYEGLLQYDLFKNYENIILLAFN